MTNFLNSNFPQSLISLCTHWDNDTKGDMLESINNDIENGLTLKESLQILINEHFPVWIDESPDDKQFYIDYQQRFINLGLI